MGSCNFLVKDSPEKFYYKAAESGTQQVAIELLIQAVKAKCVSWLTVLLGKLQNL